MNKNFDFSGLSMDEIVFENRNKDYGAFALRGSYQKLLLKALLLSCGIFIFGLFTPKIISSLGLFAGEDKEELDTHVVIHLPPPPDSKPDEPETPPPPPVEEIQRPTAKFLEMEASKTPDEDPPPTIQELEDKDPGLKDQKGDPDADPIIQEIVDNPGLGEDNKVYTVVDQPPSFIGGEDAFQEFLHDNLIYPEEEKRLENTGVSTISFVVNKDGKLEDVKVYTPSGYARFDAEAARVIRLCNGRFRPGKNNGKAVKTVCVIPITFELEEDE